jgi:hypothetical protein
MIESSKERLEQLVKDGLGLARNREVAKNILSLLFPKVEEVEPTFLPTNTNLHERRIRRRVSIADYSENYFTLTPDPDDWSQLEFEKILGNSPEDAFNALERKLAFAPVERKSDLRRNFLELLEAEFSSRKMLNEAWVLTILDHSKELLVEKDEETKFLFTFGNFDRLRWLLRNGIERLPVEERASILRTAIAQASDMSVLADLIRGLIGDTNPNGSKSRDRQNFLGESSDEIAQQLLSRIRDLSRSGQIWTQSDPGRLLWFWWGANHEDEVRLFTSSAMETETGLRGLLVIPISLVRSSAGNYEHVGQEWSRVIDIDALEKKAHKLLEESSPTDRQIAARFLEALQRGLDN